MKKVYLIRHGQPDFPEGKRMCLGITDIPLSQQGLAQAEEMARKLPEVSAVYSSPLTRAVQTAQAIGLPITILDDLRELNAGQWDGLCFDEIQRRFGDLYAARGSDPTLPLPGGEDHAQGLARFRAAVEQAVKESPGDLAVVAHGGVIAQFLKVITGQWRKPGYAEIVPLIWENGEFRLQEEDHYA